MQTRTRWFLLFLLAWVLFVLLPVNPAVQQTPGRDSGMFLYIGQQIREGRQVYTQVWDHKPPLVFFLNAAGLWLGQGTLWGVWALQVVFLFAAAVLAGAVLVQAFGLFSGAAALALAFLTLSQVLHGGNYTEEYALPLQLGAIFFFMEASREGRRFIPALISGILAGLAFLFKPTQIASGLAIGFCLAVMALRRRKVNLAGPAAFAGGFALAFGLVGLYFLAGGSFADYWEAAYRYNSAYSNLGLLERITALFDTLETMSGYPGFVFGLAGWMLGVVLLVRHLASDLACGLRYERLGLVLFASGVGLLLLIGLKQYSGITGQAGLGLLEGSALLLGSLLVVGGGLSFRFRWLRRLSDFLEKQNAALPDAAAVVAGLAVIWYPVELVMVGLSARNYTHYFISLVPVTAILIGLLVWYFERSGSRAGNAPRLALAALAAAAAVNPLIGFAGSMRPGADAQITAAAAYLRAHSLPEEKVLSWGGDPLVNFFAQRALPTRYVHMYPFYLADSSLQARTEELLAELQAYPPVLILDTLNEDTPFLGGREGAQCAQPVERFPQELQPVLDFVCSNYRLVTQVGAARWPVYVLKNSE